jgi:crossover junction endodeoxyribonuclease RuvC
VAAAVEGLFHAKNAASAFKLAHARGVVFLAAARRGIPIFEYSPLEVKSAVTGYGSAEKPQVEAMIRALLSLEGNLSHHACDALAVAVCHLHTDGDRTLRGAV